MIRLGLRLTLGSGREAALRCFVTAAASGGCAVLVPPGDAGALAAALAGVLDCRLAPPARAGAEVGPPTDRGAWLDTSAQATRSTSTSNQLWWLSGTDQFDNLAIDRIDVAATGPKSPVPPGLRHLPGPGEYYASPALTALLRTEPSDPSVPRHSPPRTL